MISATPGQPAPAAVGFLLIPGFALMSYASAVEPLRAANVLSGRELYRWWHVTPDDKPVAASNGITILPDFAKADVTAPVMLFVCAGGNPAIYENRKVFAWLRQTARRGVILGGISGGPYILAKAGLLDGRRCTLHWEHIASLKENFPDVNVTRSLFEIDRHRITCSGGIAGLDMMIALIAETHGQDLAMAISEWFLHTELREGPFPQRMDLRFRHGVGDDNLLRVLKAMEDNLERPLPRARLAKTAGVSLRQLERLFRRHLNRGLHQHYLKLRLTQAHELLRGTSLPVTDIAVATGFASGSQFSRAYRREFGRAASAVRATRWPAQGTIAVAIR
jgi:transcriptional regulator GlxA family with amidase domain